MQTSKQRIGRKGEELALDFIREKGYTLCETNYRWKKSEIDIILRVADLLVFVEVKTRGTVEFGMPEAFVTRKQIRKIQQAALHYIAETNWKGPVRFDVIAIVMEESGSSEITHFKDAF